MNPDEEPEKSVASPEEAETEQPEELSEEFIPIQDHLEPDVKQVCGYCGKEFAAEEVVIEKEIHGRRWCFCNDECFADFQDALDFQDEDKDGYDATVHVGGHAENDDIE